MPRAGRTGLMGRDIDMDMDMAKEEGGGGGGLDTV
jgi:hypothetical protein